MAGRHRGKVTEPRVRLTLKIPEALKAHLQDEAAKHKRSLNEELTRTLEAMARYRTKRSIRQKLMELEPMATDPNVPIEDVVAAMERINPYRPHSNGSAG